MANFCELNANIVACRQCPRLVHFRETVPPRASFKDEAYWRKPLPGYGDENGWLLILGLAPAAHGGNRTGRVLTGDLTAKFLFQALHAQAWANQPSSLSKDDGLILSGVYLTAAVKCVPPQDKPLSLEMRNCHSYLEHEMHFLTNLTSVLALGKIAFDAALKYLQIKGVKTRGMKFSHGAHYFIPHHFHLWGSYHPSPRNTNTGLMNQEMFQKLLKKIEMSKS